MTSSSHFSSATLSALDGSPKGNPKLDEQIDQILQTFQQKIASLPDQSTQNYLQPISDALQALLPLCEQIPLPGQGQTRQRWRILAKVAACDLNLAKLFESHLDALAILAELGVTAVPKGLWAVWAAQGGSQPVQLIDGICEGKQLWCSGASLVDYALISYTDEQGISQLMTVDMSQPQIQTTTNDWQAVGMAFTDTATVEFQQVVAHKLISKQIPPNSSPYLDRAGFWHGAAGVSACWYGAAVQLAATLLDSYQQKPHVFKAVYLGEVSQILSVTHAYFYQVAALIDQSPTQSHELASRILRAQVEFAATQVINLTGKALGAAPFCKNDRFARLSADLSVFIRQTHGAFDAQNIGEITAQLANKGELWQL